MVRLGASSPGLLQTAATRRSTFLLQKTLRSGKLPENSKPTLQFLILH